MSDTRRRRKSEQSGGSDDLSGSYDELNVTKETQNSEQTEEHHDSEYDTAGSDAESEAGSQDGDQRESGDGQEEDKPQKKLDDDEDRRNPQYIPKRGTFYEHDDRTAEEGATEGTVEPPPERETKEKKVWKDKEDRWDHDRYNDDEQAPKSHEELIAAYGYDIRNEEGPPRARRRRRYGRGPNKYTRNWEDEDAYGKPVGNNLSGQKPRRSNRSGEEFPALKGTKEVVDTVEEPVISSAWYSNKNKPQNKQQNFPPLQTQLDTQNIQLAGSNNTQSNENKAPNEPTNPAWKKDAKYTSQSLSPTRNSLVNEVDKTVYIKQNYGNKRQVQESVSLAASRVRGRGFKPSTNNNLLTNRTLESKPKGRGGGLITGDIRRNNTCQQDEEQLSNDMKHMNVNEGPYHLSGRQNKNFYAQPANQQRPHAAQARMQPPTSQQPPPSHQPSHQPQALSDVVGNRPKRYSSLRQRPAMPEVSGQPAYPQQHNQHAPHGQHGQHGFYPPQAGNSHAVLESQGFPPGHFEPAAPVPTTVSPMAGQAVMPLTPAGQPPGYAPPPFLVPPPQFIPPQAAPPSIINYVPGPNGPAFQPNFPGYQSYNPTVQPQGPPPPPELFQPQGCTYYNPAQQSPQQQQAAPIRRPKVAIPILPPPDNSQHHQSSRGRGRTVNQLPQANMPGNVQLRVDFENQSEVAESNVKLPVEAFENSQFDLTQNEPERLVESVRNKISPVVDEGNKIINSKVEQLVDSVESSNTQGIDLSNDKNKTTSVKNVEIDVTISQTEITRVENVVHENPVVEEAAA